MTFLSSACEKKHKDKITIFIDFGTWKEDIRMEHLLRADVNSLHYCRRAGAPKVTVNHRPAPDAGLLCWYVHTLITQAANKLQSTEFGVFFCFFSELFRLLKLTLLGLFLWRLWVGHLIWAPCVPLTHTHLSLSEWVAAFAKASGNY